jgi:FKBP-type peptidyl-prolyl cis-trans isomerase
MMKKLTAAALFVSAASACSGGGGGAMETVMERGSYAIGVDVARSVQRTGADLDVDLLIAGLRDQMAERQLRIPEDSLATVMREFAMQLQEDQAREQEAQMTANREEGEAFMASNADDEGVVTTESGLQYQVLDEGDGASPTATDVVTVHYVGTLLDGTEFDSSHRRGQPATFPVNGVIPGWTEALQLMKVGSKYKLWVPAELGYGPQGSPPDIGPNATLVFEVELLGIE